MSEVVQFDSHPNAESIGAFLERSLPEWERLRVTDHLATCSRCREVLFLAQSAGDEAELVAEARPRPRANRPAWLAGWRFAWAPALALAMMIAVAAPLAWLRWQNKLREPDKLDKPDERAIASASHPGAQYDRPVGAVQALPSDQPHAERKPAVPARPAAFKSERPQLVQPAAVEPQKMAAMAKSLPQPPSRRSEPAPETVTVSGADQAVTVSAASVVSADGGGGQAVGGQTQGQAAAQISRAQQIEVTPMPAEQSMSARKKSTPLPTVSQMDMAPLAAVNGIQAAAAGPAASIGGTVDKKVAEEPAHADPAKSPQHAPARMGASISRQANAMASMGPPHTSNAGSDSIAAKSVLYTKLPNGSLAVSTAAARDRLLALDSQGGLFLSLDHGKTWEPVSHGWNGRALQVRVAAQPIRPSAQTPSPAAPQVPTGCPTCSSPPRTNENSKPVFELVTDEVSVWTSSDGQIWKRK